MNTNRFAIHNLPIGMRPEYGALPGVWIDVGKTKARFLRDTPKVPHGTVGTITKILGLGRVELTLEDGSTQRQDLRLLQLLRDE